MGRDPLAPVPQPAFPPYPSCLAFLAYMSTHPTPPLPQPALQNLQWPLLISDAIDCPCGLNMTDHIAKTCLSMSAVALHPTHRCHSRLQKPMASAALRWPTQGRFVVCGHATTQKLIGICGACRLLSSNCKGRSAVSCVMRPSVQHAGPRRAVSPHASPFHGQASCTTRACQD